MSKWKEYCSAFANDLNRLEDDYHDMVKIEMSSLLRRCLNWQKEGLASPPHGGTESAHCCINQSTTAAAATAALGTAGSTSTSAASPSTASSASLCTSYDVADNLLHGFTTSATARSTRLPRSRTNPAASSSSSESWGAASINACCYC